MGIHGSTTGFEYDIRYKYIKDNPNLGTELMLIGRQLHLTACPLYSDYPREMTPLDKVAFYKKLRDRYWDVILEKHTILLGKGKINVATATDDMKELLRRGFISRHDVIDFTLKKWVVWHPHLNLIWPIDFNSREEAQKVNSHFGISGTIIVQILKENHL